MDTKEIIQNALDFFERSVKVRAKMEMVETKGGLISVRISALNQEIGWQYQPQVIIGPLSYWLDKRGWERIDFCVEKPGIGTATFRRRI